MAEAVSGYAASYVLGATCEFWSFLTITPLKAKPGQFSTKDRQEVPKVTTEGRVSVFFPKLSVQRNIFCTIGGLEILGIFRAMTKKQEPKFQSVEPGSLSQ